MKTIQLSAASQSLAEYAATLGEEVLVLADGDEPIAALVSLRGVDRESAALAGHPAFLKIVEPSRSEIRSGRTISLAAMQAAFASQPAEPAAAPVRKRRRPTKN